MMLWYDVICIFSIVIVAFQLARYVMPWIYVTFVGPLLFKVDFKKYGSWGVVTGATDGIGLEYARKLAKKGLNVVLIGRSQLKLQKVAERVERESSVQTQIICVDFKNTIDIYEKIEKQINSLDIGVLVNNVGISYSNPEYFLQIPSHEQFVSDIVSCNILSTVQMTKIVLHGMVQRKRGIIINLSSMAAQIPSPLLSVYAASKAFVDKFSIDLSTEYEKDGIIVQSLAPGTVATNMTKIRKASWMAPTPERFVSSAVKTILVSRSTTGYFPHDLMKFGINNVAGIITPVLSRHIVFRRMKFLRERAIGKVGTV